MGNKVLDLSNRREVDREMRNYLKLECPHYLGAKPSSVEFVGDFEIKLFEGEVGSRVLVYDVRLQNESGAFGTVGGILYPEHPPCFNVFPKSQAGDARVAARMHLYWEACNRYGGFFSKEENLRDLAEILDIPEELR